MLKKFLGDAIILVAGKQAEEIANLLDDKKYLNEFLIAKKMNLTINQTRNILYKISDHGLVSFIRKKDKKKGWYTYFWKIEALKSLEFLKDILAKKIDQLDHQVKSRETKLFYVCERCNIEFNEENALLHNFTCGECGDIFVVKDNSKLLREMNRNLDRLRKELQSIEEEIGIEKDKAEKQRVKVLKKEEKIKAEEKAKKRAAGKLAKKVEKKVAKKKVSKKIAVKKKKVSKLKIKDRSKKKK